MASHCHQIVKMYSFTKLFVVVTVIVLAFAGKSATGGLSLSKTGQENSSVTTSSHLERKSINTEICPVITECEGVVGPKGRWGHPGLHGIPGRKGNRGLPGLDMICPAVGLPGVSCPQGRPGEPGPRGDKGPRGPSGRDGLRGRRGPHGIRSEKGEPGSPGARGFPGPCSRGVVYTRWGKRSCPSNSGTELLYAGQVGGAQAGHSGGGANYLCMPLIPQYSSYTPGSQGRGYISGVEYDSPVGGTGTTVDNHGATCAVCYVPTREFVTMIPARTDCPSSWTREYYGYLMTAHHSDSGRSSYVCVDSAYEPAPNSSGNHNAGHFYHVEATCDSLPCPPYVNYKELTCTVCTK